MNPFKMVQNAVKQVQNALFSRSELAAAQNTAGQEGRDIDETCGYRRQLLVDDYQEMYDRFGVAARVVGCFPDESWRRPPAVYEDADEEVVTPFEAAWSRLFQNPDTNPWHYLHRVDVLSGVGHFGVLLLGLGDGRELDRPVKVAAGAPTAVLFLRAFAEGDVRVKSVYTDRREATFGKPEMYQIRLLDPSVSADPANDPSDLPAQGDGGDDQSWADVHADRVLHVADNRYSSELYGVPRQQQVFNYLLDLKKVGGGSAEMFWQSAAPGYAIETHPSIPDPQMDKESLKEEYANWRNGQQRFIALEGLSIKSLAPQVADPTAHGTFILQLVCATIGFPLRSFLGAEAGQLASETDKDNLNDRLARRQENYLTPYLVRGLVRKLVAAGAVPEPATLYVDWQELTTLKEAAKADISVKRVQALLQYVTSGAELVMPVREFLTRIMYFSTTDAAAIMAAVDAGTEPWTKELWEQVQEGTGNPSDPAAKTGLSGKRNAQG